MQGLYRKDFTKESLLVIQDEDFHHLIKVLRHKEGDQICLLDGEGFKSIVRIEKLTQKSFQLCPREILFEEQKNSLKMILCLSKSIEDCLKIAVECGLKDLYLYKSSFSQEISLKRSDKIIKQAMEQSLNPYFLQLHFLETLPYSVTFCTNQKEGRFEKTDYYLIGPEGGFSENDLQDGKSFLKFSTSILRTPTAFSYALGFLKSSI